MRCAAWHAWSPVWPAQLFAGLPLILKLENTTSMASGTYYIRVHVSSVYNTRFSNAYPAPARLQAQLRGVLRASCIPITFGQLTKELGVEGLALGGGGGVVGALLEELVAEGAVSGQIKTSGSLWVPHIYASTQQDAAK